MKIEKINENYYLNDNPVDIIALLVYDKENTLGEIFISNKTYKNDFYRFILDVITKLQLSVSEYDEELDDEFNEFRNRIKDRFIKRCEAKTFDKSMGEERL